MINSSFDSIQMLMLVFTFAKCCIFPLCPGIADVLAGSQSASGALLGPGPCRPPPPPGPGHSHQPLINNTFGIQHSGPDQT